MDRLITLGLSDLHLGQAQCPISENLFSLLDSIKTLDTLIVSGDLFEVWLGDDASTDFQWHIAERFKAIGAKTSVFLPGNRDFLLGEAWLQAAGMTPHLSFTHRGMHWSHGDEFCTQDVEYIAWRHKSRSPEFTEHFLSLSLEQRQAFASKARETSRETGKQTQSHIADVTPASVPDGHIVHGHTHRPAVHRRPNGNRIVMGDWRPEAWVYVETPAFTGLKKWHHGWRAEIKI